MSKTLDPLKPHWSLACKALSVQRGRRRVLEGVDFALRPGECVSIIGPNGSGKTTLMLTLLGLLPPAAGAVRLNNTDIQAVSPRRRARWAAYVPQGLGPAPAFTVAEIVAGGRYAHVSELHRLTEPDLASVERALGMCGLSALRDRLFNSLSGGERQKTLIAAAIAQDPQLLCLDEPLSALDPAYQIELVRILRSWLSPARSVLLISHDLQLPQVLGGRVVALRAGHVVADGTVAEVLDPAALQALYDAPFTIATTAEGRRLVLPAW